MPIPSPLEAAHPVVHWRLRGLRSSGLANPDSVDRAERIATSTMLLRPDAGEPCVRLGVTGTASATWAWITATGPVPTGEGQGDAGAGQPSPSPEEATQMLRSWPRWAGLPPHLRQA